MTINKGKSSRDSTIGKLLVESSLEAFKNGVSAPAQEMCLLFNPWGFNLKDITYPVTIWQGGLDTQVPISHGNIYANLMSASELILFESEGHTSLIHNYIKEILQSVCA